VTVGQATIDHDELIGIVRVILFGLENWKWGKYLTEL
jgi:hypothetical protein